MKRLFLKNFPVFILLIFTLLIGACGKKPSVLIFSVMGDVPRSAFEDTLIQKQIAAHNRFSPSEFMLHVGDIKDGNTPCTEEIYVKVAEYLKKLKVPTFIVPGDNEWNDCENPDQAWQFWINSFLDFEKNWKHGPKVIRQKSHPVNMAWIADGVLMIGLNLQGGRIHDPEEWEQRHTQCTIWVEDQLTENRDKVRALVVFCQANPDEKHSDFIESFLESVRHFKKPVLFLHGDGHRWLHDNPWLEPNMVRVQVDKGLLAVPLEVTVTLDKQNMFLFEREPFMLDE